jgi:UDP:flavonoid glycosyltransferase YjiC (YdhE family)
LPPACGSHCSRPRPRLRTARLGTQEESRAIASVRVPPLPLCEEWQPHILVCDEADFGVIVAAERLGLPHASFQTTASGSLVPPTRLRARDAAPLTALLAHCDLVVSHGGSGSVVGALLHGLPMVVIPIADQPRNARRCEDLHIARVVNAPNAKPDLVREAVSDVLADPTCRLNAERIRGEIAVMPGPDRAVTLLERLAAERSPPFRGEGSYHVASRD